MNKQYILGAYVLTMAVAVWVVAKDRRPNKQTPQSALIMLEGIYSRDGLLQTTAISVVDRKTLEKLEAFFPKYRTFPSSDRAGGWEAGYRVYFNFDQGRSVRVTISRNGGDTWTIGDGDFATQGDFPAFVEALVRRAGR